MQTRNRRRNDFNDGLGSAPGGEVFGWYMFDGHIGIH